jgi:hypothetical protein
MRGGFPAAIGGKAPAYRVAGLLLTSRAAATRTLRPLPGSTFGRLAYQMSTFAPVASNA